MPAVPKPMVSESLQAACDNAIRTARRGDTRSSVGLARHAYRLARQESQEAELEALNAMALCQGANGSHIESIATSIDAFRLARQTGHRSGAAYALTTMAAGASFILDADKVVLDMLAVCRGEADALEDSVLLARVLNTLGLVYGNLQRFDEADREYDAGIQLVLNSAPRAGVVTPAYLMSGNKAFLAVLRAKSAPEVQRESSQADAERRIEYVLAIANREANIDAQARALFCLGQLRALQGRYDESLTAFEDTLERANRIRHNPRLIDTYIEVSKLYAAQEKYELALEALEQAFEIADANRPTNKVYVACEGMEVMYRSVARLREAAHYRAKTVRERESFIRENELAVRDLTAFWRTVAAGQASDQTLTVGA
ncbi:MAG: tetratricopeptide repeat protein [Betaproteobacteria bacterium]|nr:tetratricopeptide repeat protein [Betaproteobacteria bacterium]